MGRVTERKAEAFRDDMGRFWERHHDELSEALRGNNGLATTVWGDVDMQRATFGASLASAPEEP